ncbi:hypothetical protein F1C16_06050 [Hymenobacter sp. NBH84]|uniref:DUF6044 family protein n=1 Tax=Hymenobacter sp. NBH84 TaxID=2596915 RepID=UPI00162778C9|nr:DUF6044 family protein [Hymenobacter sp. NBH84]QNE39147.1 hypothetical protein F1C16_06050 [Hymenobacter sp. NBH84]
MPALFRFPTTPLRQALLVLVLLLLPVWLLGEHAYLSINDNLDSELVAPSLLPRLGVLLDYRSTAVVPPLMDGLPRNALRSGLSVTMQLFAVLPPLPAYLLHALLVRLVALLGFYALARTHWLRKPEDAELAALLALAWATLPMHTIYGLSVGGQPWVLWAVLNLREGRRRGLSWLTLAVFPLWSMFVYVGPFLLAGIGGLLAWDWWHGRRAHLGAVLLGAGLLLASYLVVEYPLLYSLLIAKQFVSHRVEFDISQLLPMSFLIGLKSTLHYLLMGQYLPGLFFRGVILAVVAVALTKGEPATRRALGRQLLPLGIVLVLTAVFCGFYPQLLAALQAYIPLLRTFNVGRFHFLTPLLWFVVLVLSLRALPPGRLRVGLAVVQLLLGLAMNTEWTTNLRHLAGVAPATEPSYAAYVAPRLFARVRALLHERTGQEPPAYRVACLGLPPSVAQLNGFYTLDSYQNNYPLRYKHQFRPLIAGELAKDPALRAYFDAWGNRCYLFSAELGRNFRVGAAQRRVVQHWAFDAAAFRRLGGRFVLSAARLARPQESGLRLLAVQADAAAYWQLFVYEVALPSE